MSRQFIQSLTGELSFLAQPLVRTLASQGTMGPVIVVEVLPLLQLSVETTHILNHDTFEQTVEFFFIDAV